jgi:ATP-dependent DNA helicase RecG
VGVSYTNTLGTDVIQHRADLLELVDRALRARTTGSPLDEHERTRLDFKEEAGRRGRDGSLLPGTARNLQAADHLADEVACMANTPGGGALLVGFDDKTGEVVGADLDPEWLRHRIHERVDIAPAIEERFLDGSRILVVLVAEAREPVEDTRSRLRWRVGGHCDPIDRAEWWLHQQRRRRHDTMAEPTTRTLGDVSPRALLIARAHLEQAVGASDTVMDDAELLRYLGVLPPGGNLTQAGALLFCPADRSLIEYGRWDVEGGDVIDPGPNLRGQSLLEQINTVEQRLDAANTVITLKGAFSETAVRRLPPRAVREAVLNGLTHRDWTTPEPTRVTWIDLDSALEVVSPGGFVGGVDADNILSEHYARYPALADLMRAVGLVDKKGIGVDRMYREMVALGHRPPAIEQTAGPRVRTRLRGGDPVLPVLDLMSAIRPSARRNDVKVALLVHTLLHQPFLDPETLAPVLQRDSIYAAEAIEVAAAARIADGPLIEELKDVWVLSNSSLEILERRRGTATSQVLPYRRPSDEQQMLTVVRRWLARHPSISSGEYGRLVGLTTTGGRGHLDRLVEAGFLQRGPGVGRNAHYLRVQGPDPAGNEAGRVP